MGQYHLPINLDKREFLSPHALGDGLKLLEQGLSNPGGVMTAIHVLLAVSNGRGGGDYANGIQHGYGRRSDVPKGATIRGEYGDSVSWILEDEKFSQLVTDVVGRWGGDRIAIVGDYAEEEDLPDGIAPIAYALCSAPEDIREHIEHLRQNETRLEDEEDDAANPSFADRLETELNQRGPFTDITPMVRRYLENCDTYYHVFNYGDGDGWITREFALERRAGV